MLAPFWIEALGISPSIVLVHRHPFDVAQTLSEDEHLSFEDGLVLWDEYNRSALSLWEDLPGIVIGIEAFESDLALGLAELIKHLRRFDIVPTDGQILAAQQSFHGFGQSSPDGPEREVPNRYLVLHRALSQLDLAASVDSDQLVQEFANYYDEEYYAHYGNEGDAPYLPGEPQWSSFFSNVADRINEEIKPTSVLDAGCAIGFLVEALRDRGIDARGIDVSEWAIAHVPPSVAPYCSVASLTDEIDGHFDLITIIEVIEHMPESVAGFVIANLTCHAESVLFSSTSEGFEEATHINVRTPDHWARLFAASHFFRDFEYDATYLSPDAVLFRRGSPDLIDSVIGYEQYAWRSSKKAQEVLDGFISDREELLATINEYAERVRTLEMENHASITRADELTEAVHDAERGRNADALAHQAHLLQRDREIVQLSEAHRRVMGEMARLEAEVAAIESTRLFRYSAGLRRTLRAAAWTPRLGPVSSAHGSLSSPSTRARPPPLSDDRHETPGSGLVSRR